MPLDEELLSLLNDVHSNNINGHGYRGYSIAGKSITEVAVSYFFQFQLFGELKLIFNFDIIFYRK